MGVYSIHFFERTILKYVCLFQDLLYVEVGLNARPDLRPPNPVRERVEYASLDLNAMKNRTPPPPAAAAVAQINDLGQALAHKESVYILFQCQVQHGMFTLSIIVTTISAV